MDPQIVNVAFYAAVIMFLLGYLLDYLYSPEEIKTIDDTTIKGQLLKVCLVNKLFPVASAITIAAVAAAGVYLAKQKPIY